MEPSHLDFHCLQTCVRIYLMSEFTRLYPKGIQIMKRSQQLSLCCEEVVEFLSDHRYSADIFRILGASNIKPYNTFKLVLGFVWF